MRLIRAMGAVLSLAAAAGIPGCNARAVAPCGYDGSGCDVDGGAGEGDDGQTMGQLHRPSTGASGPIVARAAEPERSGGRAAPEPLLRRR